MTHFSYRRGKDKLNFSNGGSFYFLYEEQKCSIRLLDLAQTSVNYHLLSLFSNAFHSPVSECVYDCACETVLYSLRNLCRKETTLQDSNFPSNSSGLLKIALLWFLVWIIGVFTMQGYFISQFLLVHNTISKPKTFTRSINIQMLCKQNQ